MKVKDLIAKLATYNQEAEVATCHDMDTYGGTRYYIPVNVCEDYTKFPGEKLEEIQSPIVVIANSQRARG